MKTMRFLLVIGVAAGGSSLARAAAAPALGADASAAPSCDMTALGSLSESDAADLGTYIETKQNYTGGGRFKKNYLHLICSPEILNFVADNPAIKQSFESAVLPSMKADLLKAVLAKFAQVEDGEAKVVKAAQDVYAVASKLNLTTPDGQKADGDPAISATQAGDIEQLLKQNSNWSTPKRKGYAPYRLSAAVPGDLITKFYQAYLDYGTALNKLKQAGSDGLAIDDSQYNCKTDASVSDPNIEEAMKPDEQSISGPGGALDTYDPKLGQALSTHFDQVNGILDRLDAAVVGNHASVASLDSDKKAADLQAKLDGVNGQLRDKVQSDLGTFFDDERKRTGVDPTVAQQNFDALKKSMSVTPDGNGGALYNYTAMNDKHSAALPAVPTPNDISNASLDIVQHFEVAQQVADNIIAGRNLAAKTAAAKSAIIGPPAPTPTPAAKPTPAAPVKPAPALKVSGVTLRPDTDQKPNPAPSQPAAKKPDTAPAPAPAVTTTKSADAPPFKSPSLTDRILKPSTWFKSDAQLIAQQQKRAINEDAAKRSAERQKILEDERNKIAAIKASGAPDAGAQITAAKAAAQQQLAQNAADQTKVNEQVSETTQTQLDGYYKSKIPSALSAIQSRYSAAPYVVQRNLKQGGPQTVSRRDELAREAGIDPKLVTNSVIASYFKKLQSDAGIAAIQGKLNLANPSARNVENRYVHDDFVQYLKTTLGGRN